MTWTKSNFITYGFLLLSCLTTKVLGGVTFEETLELAFKNNEDVLIQKERIQKAARGSSQAGPSEIYTEFEEQLHVH